MQLISVKEAVSLIKVPDSTLRDWIDNGTLEKYKDEKGFICLDKRQVLRLMPTVIAFYNYKGGVSKTSMSILMGDYYEKRKEKILLIDLDPQSNLTKSFFSDDDIHDGVNHEYRNTLYDFFNDKKSLSKIVMHYNDYIDVLPSKLELMEKSTINDFDLLDYKIEFSNFFKKYSIVIIDCPPALNAFTSTGLLLANYVYIPFVPEPFAYDGLVSMLKTMQKITPYNKDFIDYRIVYSKVKGQKTIIHENYINHVNTQMSGKIIDNHKIPDFIGIVERGASKQNIFDMYPGDTPAQKITELFDELDKIMFEERT